jgi:large subunit ribosomal protein L4
MEVTIYNSKGEKAGSVQLPKDLFEVKMNAALVYQVATTQMGNQRQSNAHTKGRGQVSGGGKKPWRQKGTGRARQGSIRSPQWRHGGVVFGPTNEKVYGGKINKKMRRKALAMVLSAKAASNSLVMMDSLAVTEPKTKEIVQMLGKIRESNTGFGKGSILIALPGYEKNTILAARNIAGVRTIEAVKLNVLDLLNTKYLLMPVQSLDSMANNSERTPGDEEAKKVAKGKKSVKTAKTNAIGAKIKK